MPLNDYLPTATLEMLRLRARLLGVVRRFFEQRGYLEVETPILSHDVVVDAWLEPFAVPVASVSSRSAPAASALYLQTSPEFHMKRLLAAGAEALFQVTHAFRQGECGRYHNPEFTMLEWYKVGTTHHDQMDLVEDLVSELLSEVLAAVPAEQSGNRHAGEPGAMPRHNRPAGARGSSAATLQLLRRPFQRVTYDELFRRYCGRTVLECSAGELLELCRRGGVVPPPGLAHDDRDGWLNLLLNSVVEPALRRETSAVFVHDYPASQAALARVRPENPPVAERFELYLWGCEICNGYHELTDAEELRRRIARQNELRRRAGLPYLPEHSRLLDAMQAGRLPDCAGVALGFDRLVMTAVGAESLQDVLAFPFDRA